MKSLDNSGLEAFADFLVDWGIDEPFWASLLVQIPRSYQKEGVPLCLKWLKEDRPTLQVSAAFFELPDALGISLVKDLLTKEWNHLKAQKPAVHSPKYHHFKRLLRSASLAGGRSQNAFLDLGKQDAPPQRSGPTWKAVLRRHLRKMVGSQIGVTNKKVSKRYGIAPGIKIRQRAKIVVVMDTSASVEVDLLHQFRKEIMALYRLGHHIKLIEADDQIQDCYTFRGAFKNNYIQGRGGTNFNPALLLGKQLQATLIIYFTDGEAVAPTIDLSIPIIWCLTQSARLDRWEDFPGTKIGLF